MQHRESGALYALKALPRGFSAWRRELLTREVVLQTHLRHVGVVGLHACLLTRHLFGIVME